MAAFASIRLAIAGLELPHPASPVAPFLTISAGVATATVEELTTPEELVAAADKALYMAKRAGRNRVIAGKPEALRQEADYPTVVNPS